MVGALKVEQSPHSRCVGRSGDSFLSTKAQEALRTHMCRISMDSKNTIGCDQGRGQYLAPMH